ncbi:helix-turn-helix domain-containing protein [Myxococcota bacterium]|nr:helix-turn-helix domain-containing protein [Myxococcota bacterium]
MIETRESLAQMLGRALDRRGESVDAIADRTKLPRTTIRALLGADDPAILPQRVYLRGHLTVLARELGVSVTDALAAFDREHPVAMAEEPRDEPRFPRTAVAGAAALCTIGIIAVLLAFLQ